jgi:hypothetical protein
MLISEYCEERGWHVGPPQEEAFEGPDPEHKPEPKPEAVRVVGDLGFKYVIAIQHYGSVAHALISLKLRNVVFKTSGK